MAQTSRFKFKYKMEFRFTILLLVVVVGLIDSSEDSLEELNYLKELYRLNTNKGCGTEIKCDLPSNITHDWLLGNPMHGGYSCCYDCSVSCTEGQRCYQGWQCCGQDDSQKEETELIKKYDYLDEFVICESAFLYHLASLNITPPYLQRLQLSYAMVSKCPFDYRDLETIEKCTTPTSMLPVLGRIPYISTTTMYVYKNIHCVRCHNLSYQEIVPFSLSVNEVTTYSINELSIISQFETVQDIIQFNTVNSFINHDKEDYVLVRALPELFGKHKDTVILPKPCYKDGIDISSVEAVGDIADVHIRACKMFNFPIYVSRLYAKQEIFKNLACAFIKISSFLLRTTTESIDVKYRGGPLPACTLEDIQGPRLVVNIRPALNQVIERDKMSKQLAIFEAPDNITNEYSNITIDQLAETPARNEASDNITNQFSNITFNGNSYLDINYQTRGWQHPCSNGFFMDPHQKRCRKILCPQRFYIYKGRCEPVYLETIRYSYFTLVKISPIDRTPLLTRLHSVPVTQVISTLTGMNICGHLVFTKKIKRDIHYIVLAIWLTPKSDSEIYGDIIGRIRKIYNNDLYHLRDSLSDILGGLIISAASEIFIEPSWISKRAFDTVDKRELRRLPTADPALLFSDQRCGPALSITSLAYCVRVKLHPTEYRFVNDTLNLQFTIILVATGKTIYINHYEQMAEGYISICISDYLQVNRSAKPNNRTTLTAYPTDDIDIYIIIGLGVLFVLLIAAIVYCRVN